MMGKMWGEGGGGVSEAGDAAWREGRLKFVGIAPEESAREEELVGKMEGDAA